MKDEIKEILECIKDKKRDYVGTNGCLYQDLYRKELNLLLDYITNLQEELEEEKRIEQASLDTINNLQDTLKDREEYCYGLETQITNLQEENERLKDSLETMTFTAKVKQEAVDSLISRIDKAIEYIRENFQQNTISGSEYLITYSCCTDLLNILE